MSHLVSAKCVLMGFSVDHCSIFSLFPPNFSCVDKKEYFIHQTSEH